MWKEPDSSNLATRSQGPQDQTALGHMLQIWGISKPCPQGTSLHKVPCTTYGKHCCTASHIDSNPVLTDFSLLSRDPNCKRKHTGWPEQMRNWGTAPPSLQAASKQHALGIILPPPPQAIHGRETHRRCPGIAKLDGNTSNACSINLPSYESPPKMVTNGTMMQGWPPSLWMTVDLAGLATNTLKKA